MLCLETGICEETYSMFPDAALDLIVKEVSPLGITEFMIKSSCTRTSLQQYCIEKIVSDVIETISLCCPTSNAHILWSA
jgi:hypothetical protein